MKVGRCYLLFRVELLDLKILIPHLLGARAAVGPSLGFNGSPGHSDAYLYSYMSNSSVLDLSQVDSKVYKRVSELYPDEPSLGSPFGTGNSTFGLPQIFKRLAAWYGMFIFAFLEPLLIFEEDFTLSLRLK